MTGLAPKEAARIARFERTHQLLRRTPHTPLVQVAIACGYADQAHLAREWRALTGDNIRTWLHEELPFIQDAEARWPDGGGVMFGSRGKPGDWGALGPQGIYVAVAEAATVDAVWARVQQAANIEILQALHDTDYGSYTFSVRDHDGNLWSVGTYLGA